ncbi:23S rRNA m(1)G-748 methyltransferase [Jatrophihabitans endophyticus]|uniref:23S rRNA m(1)G-748 methyltransferase n=1 Tax=Jatrophihabitans endophyticus TaxID=1206085 RepID=A0A1M5I9X8_9ACTN|nr:methyltransferase domain-containing protein [Jatrophihabitans endophyticus]SHG25035.1 23S rRNA m(1)G-748 methyltransferase [Jatrophihabitans endophyticus]
MTVAQPPALDRVLPALRCPLCDGSLHRDGPRLRCVTGHSYDVARQGYVNLLSGRGVATGDSAAMVAARSAVLAAGLLDGVTAAVVAAASPADGLVLDLAGGTGHYLAAVLARDPASSGVCLDASGPALRRAARAHPRAAAIGADAWGRLPLADASVSRVLSVFGPRNAAELDRVLAAAGRTVVAAPTAAHLHEVVAPLGMLRVDPHKQQRQASTFARFASAAADHVRYELRLDHAQLAALVGMGPTGAHVSPDELAARVRALPDPTTVTVAVDVTTYTR